MWTTIRGCGKNLVNDVSRMLTPRKEIGKLYGYTEDVNSSYKEFPGLSVREFYIYSPPCRTEGQRRPPNLVNVTGCETLKNDGTEMTQGRVGRGIRC